MPLDTQKDLSLLNARLEQLHSLSNHDFSTLDELFKAYLRVGCEIFDLPIGIISNISGSIYRIHTIESKDTSFQSGMEFELGDTYCSKVIKSKKVIALNHVGAEENWKTHPCYLNAGLEAYISAPIIIKKKVYGTINFSGAKERSPFSDIDKKSIQMMAQSIARLIQLKLSEDDLNHQIGKLDQFKYALDQHSIVSIADLRGDIIYANDQFCEVSKYTREELIGKNHRVLKSDEHSDDFFRDMWKTISRGNVWKGEIKNFDKEAEAYWVNSTIVPLLDDDGKIYQYLSIRTVITDRKNQEFRLRKLNEQLETFVGIVSHDIRNPIGNITSICELIEVTEDIDSANLKEYLDIIKKSADNGLKLVSELLDISAMRMGKVKLDKVDFKASELFNTCIDQLQFLSKNKQVKIISYVDDKAIIHADFNRMSQVIENLLSNAIKFSEKESTIELKLESKSDKQRISVIDKGCGIPEKLRKDLFLKHVKTSTKGTEGEQGTGFGLPLSQEILIAHNSEIKLLSELGKGSCFFFDL